MLLRHYRQTEAQVYAGEKLAAAVSAKSKAVFSAIKDKQAKIKRINELTVLLAGIYHDRTFKRRYGGLPESRKEWRLWKLE